MKNFVHLHVHTEYSLLDGAARINELCDAAKNFGMPSIAITDHGTMYGTIDFYNAAVKRGIKPIIGCEVYVKPEKRLTTFTGEKYCHLVLLAENDTGYKNLVKLVSVSSTDTKQGKPYVDKKILREYAEGIIALSACIDGEIPRTILATLPEDKESENFLPFQEDSFNQDNRNIQQELDFSKENITNHILKNPNRTAQTDSVDVYSLALKVAKEYVDIFGRENFFIELQKHDVDYEEKVRDTLIKIAHELNIGIVATNDVHYVNKADSQSQEVLMCLQQNKTLNDNDPHKLPTDEYYLKSADDMCKLFEDIPEACENTVKIAARCNVTFNFGKLHLPEFEIPPDFKDAAAYLRELCRKKIFIRYENPDEKIFTRLNAELDIIEKMGFAGYFLIVQDFINFAKENKIAVGPGRGSATGSLVSYALGITDIDPLKYNLLFERFLNPERVTMPDIDIDFCYRKRRLVIDYVKEKYHQDHVAQIITFGTMAPKAAIRDVSRVLGVAYAESTRLANLIPGELNITLDKALATSRELKKSYAENEQTRRIIDLAKKLEGMPRHASVHAAGIVISKLPLTDYLPTQIINNILVTQFDKDKIEELGLLKMDFLGLRTLTIIEDTVTALKDRGINIDVTKIPLDDKLTAQMLIRGDTGAVFQMESPGMTKLVKDLKPTCFEDLIPTIALYRPGPLGSHMIKDFVDGKHGLRKVTYLHSKLEPILRETFGVILYQEQVMQIVQALAGFTLGQADLLRRAMAKKKASILIAQKENFLKGCVSNGVEKFLAEKIFGLLEHFAGYGFNKSHSAAYAWLAWQTAYLKAHFPAEFMAATLSSVMDSDKIAVYVELARRMGLKILPPDINSSGVRFRAFGDKIFFALSAIKTLGESAIEGVVKVREYGKFTSLADFCNRVQLTNFNRHSLENLIKCGAFDKINGNRQAFISSLEKTVSVCRIKNVADYDEKLGDAINSEKRLYSEPYDKKEYFAWEKDVLGFYVSGHPLEKFSETISRMQQIRDVKDGNFKVQSAVKFGGMVTSFRRVKTKSGADMAFVTIEDFESGLSVVIFPAVFERCKDFLDEEKIVVVEGKVDISKGEVEVLADNVTPIESYKPQIYLTLTAENDTPQIFQTLKKFFAENQGDSEIYLRRFGKWKLINNQSVNEKVFNKLADLIGAANIKMY